MAKGYQNCYQDMKCVICFGKNSKHSWLGFQQKRAELAAKHLQGLNAEELRQLKSSLADVNSRVEPIEPEKAA